jgi:hypothetical protein
MQYAVIFQRKSKFLFGQRIILRALFCVALVSLSLFGQPSSSSDRAMNSGCIAMEAHVAAAEQMVIGESGDHGANMTEMHFSICASAGCVSVSIQESLPPTAFTSGDTAAFGMFEHEGGAGRAVSPEYRPPITG